VTVTSVGFLTRTLQVKLTPGYRLITTMKLGLSPGTGAAPTASPTATLTPSAGGQTKTATSSSASQTNPAKPFITIKDTPTGFLRVRMDPDTAATEAARVNPGDTYHVEASDSGWFEIKYDGTRVGWVSGQYAAETQ